MIGWPGLIVVALAAYRVARLVALDTISLPFRERLFSFAYDEEHPVEGDGEWVAAPRAGWRTWLYDLFTCPLCVGVWVSAGLYAAWRWWDTDPVRAVIVVLAVAGAQCFLATREGA